MPDEPSVEDATLRDAAPEDAPAIADVAAEAWHAAYDDVLGAGSVAETLEEWYAESALREAVTADAHPFVVAEADGSVVAFAHTGPHGERDCYVLYRIYARPAWWGSGVGSALLERVESAMRDRGVERYELGVLAENEVGVGFYESRGFERVGTGEVTLGGTTTTEYTYRKEL